MKQFVLIMGTLYGLLSVIFGAFGAHALKKILSVDQLASFEVGVRYQMIHALLLLIIGFAFRFNSGLEKATANFLILGVFLFSFSIYALAMSDKISFSVKWLGPVTPLGGLLLIIGWVCLLLSILRFSQNYP